MFRITAEEGRSTVHLTGDIDLYNVSELSATLKEAKGDITLDCAELTYIDSTGLGVLASEYADSSPKVRIVNLKTHLSRIFELTGLTQVFDIEVAK